LAHSDGIVDQRYINESGDMTYKVGQRITVSTSEIDDIVAGIGRLVAGTVVACCEVRAARHGCRTVPGPRERHCD
jgi:hypothetical protein